MKDAQDFSEIVERAKSRVGDQTDFLPYAIFEEISPSYVTAAARVCSFPLSLTDELAVKLLDFVSKKWPGAMQLGDLSSVLIDILRSSNFIINGSGERWRYEQKARQYFLSRAEDNETFAKEIHKWLWNYYDKSVTLSQNKREAWSQKLRTAYHQTPLDPKEGADSYVDLFEDDTYKGMVFQERISTLGMCQA